VLLKQGDLAGAEDCYDKAFALIQARGGPVEQACTLRRLAHAARRDRLRK